MEEKINGVRISKGEIYFLETTPNGKEVWKKDNGLNPGIKSKYISELRKKKEELINTMNQDLKKNHGIKTDLNFIYTPNNTLDIDIESITKVNDIIEINKEETFLDLFHDDFETEQTEDEDEFLKEVCKDEEDVKQSKKDVILGSYKKEIINKLYDSKNKDKIEKNIKVEKLIVNKKDKIEENIESKKVIKQNINKKDVNEIIDDDNSIETPSGFIFIKANKKRHFNEEEKLISGVKRIKIKIQIKAKKVDSKNILYVKNFVEPVKKIKITSKTILPENIIQKPQIKVKEKQKLPISPRTKEKEDKTTSKKESVLKNFFIDDDVEMPENSFFDDLS